MTKYETKHIVDYEDRVNDKSKHFACKCLDAIEVTVNVPQL